nr:MAG TPA_asm: hypothetical protein [Caudoviricetes sp.]
MSFCCRISFPSDSDILAVSPDLPIYRLTSAPIYRYINIIVTRLSPRLRHFARPPESGAASDAPKRYIHHDLK